MNSAHKALRAGTAEAHERVDAAFAGFDLTDRTSYAAFLGAHADVVLPLEAVLPGERVTADWDQRKRGHLLREDLAFLRPSRHSEGGEDVPVPETTAAIAGTLYVLEGSRLGGRFLARRLPPTFPHAYLDADQPPEKWRNLLARLDTFLYEPAEMQSALAAAHRAFAAFERAAQRWTKG